MNNLPTLKPFLAIQTDRLKKLWEDYERGHLDLSFDPEIREFDSRRSAEAFCLAAGRNWVVWELPQNKTAQ